MNFAVSRGCPYNCSFCLNHQMRNLYKNKGRYVRRRSVDNIIKEIKDTIKSYDIRIIRFPDDVFTLDKTWTLNFCKRYKKEIGIPFGITTRPDLLDENIVKGLKNAGCYSVSMGIETGDEKTRNTLLRKNLNDAEIRAAVSLLKRHNIKITTYNIIALPGETVDDIIKTIRFNIELKPENPVFSIFQPYKKLMLTEYALKQGLLTRSEVEEISKAKLFKHTVENYRIRNLRCMAFIYVKFPFLLRFNDFILRRDIFRNKFLIRLAVLYLFFLFNRTTRLNYNNIPSFFKNIISDMKEILSI